MKQNTIYKMIPVMLAFFAMSFTDSAEVAAQLFDKTIQPVHNAQKKPVKIIFDTDMCEDPEDVNALCLLHAFADEGEAEILACVASGHNVSRSSGAAKWVLSPDKNQSYLIESMPPDSIASLMEELILKSIGNAIKKP